jgi:hypothetical protein
VFLYGVWGLAAGVALVVVVSRALKELPPTKEQGTPAEVGVDVAPAEAAITDFYRTYDNQLLAETEEAIRAQLVPFQASQDRERFLVRSYATLVTAGVFEYVWVLIYGSQLRAIHYVNGGAASIEDLRRFYDAAVLQYPALAGYPFTSWLAFIKSWVLVREDDTVISITVRGREFLKYLVETGRSVDQLKY